ncbi:MAG: FMN-binding negative transcriptional regulator [Bryobacterales bacterium]|nr:FMN-binding negative transcriptional regulator [Bryobacterales bacterium]
METIYIPPHHRVEDIALMQEFIEEFSFGILVTGADGLRATHIPVLLDRARGPYGTILSHLARNNPHAQALDGTNEGLFIFQGPHSYISPAWYETKLAVPTWNFTTVHASGRPRLVEDAAVFRDFLERLVAAYDARWSMEALPESYSSAMQSGAVMFEMPVERLEGKFKLGAERSAEDRAGILEGLRKPARERTIGEMTEQWYQRHPK